VAGAITSIVDQLVLVVLHVWVNESDCFCLSGVGR